MQTTNETPQYNHHLIVLGRESRGISQSNLAKALGFSQGKISKVENGLIQLSNEELNKISQVLQYPITFFQRSDKVYGVGLSEYFHRKQQSVPQKQLNKFYAKLEIRRMEIQTLLKSIDMGETNFFSLDPDSYNGDVEKIAQIVRSTWRLPRGPIDNVVELIEEAGGIIVPFDFEDTKIDAISVWDPKMPPLIFTNFDRPMDRIRFTLCHEIGHLIMHQKPPSDVDEIESQADRFASEFLMPKADIAASLNNISLKKLAALKSYWKVSMASLLVRASTLEKITERQTRYFWMQMGKSGFRVQEPPELEPQKESPTILDEIITVYQKELSYSNRDISEAICLNESEFRGLYSNRYPHLRVL